MLKSTFLVPIVIVILTVISALSLTTPGLHDQIEAESRLIEVLMSLGDERPAHFISTLDPNRVRQGEEIVKTGRTTLSDGKKSSYVSIYYNCTSCHNTVLEDPDLRISDPEARLLMSAEKEIPFLQGTTFKGAVNHESWYNGDYVKKYGELVYAANEDIKAAIQLCATECAQGRELEDWEMEAVLQYLWSLQYQLGDLGIQQHELARINQSITSNENKEETIEWLKKQYLLYSPATFVEIPEKKAIGYEGVVGDPENGKLIYQRSCQYCHQPNGVSEVVFDDSPLTFSKLKRDIPRNDEHSIYEIIRKGTYAQPGHRPYMPHFTLERMSHQQVEDLRAYIEQQAG